MVIDFLENSHLYFPSTAFKKAFAFLKKNAGKKVKPGRYDIDGEKIYAVISAYKTVAEDSKKWESHRRYIDLHYIVSGNEEIGQSFIGSMKPLAKYDSEKDVLLYPARYRGSKIVLAKGMFAIFFPQDAHKPGRFDKRSGAVKKIVIKIEAVFA